MSHNIPSDDDFSRTSAALKQGTRGLSEVRERILSRFRTSGDIHEFFILDCSDNSFRAYVFYPWNRQIEEAERRGLASKIRDAVFDELANVGRGNRSMIDVEFEFDSDEAVQRQYEGNYYNRLR